MGGQQSEIPIPHNQRVPDLRQKAGKVVGNVVDRIRHFKFPSWRKTTQPEITEPVEPKEILHFPDIEWSVVNKPLDGEDYHVIDKAENPKISAVTVGDHAPRTHKTDSLLPFYAFCKSLTDSLVVDTPPSEITDLQELRPRSPFALSAIGLKYPTESNANYGAKVIGFRDTCTFALIPKNQDGKTYYEKRIYPISGEKAQITEDTLPPGSVIFIGSDGGIRYLAQYVYDELLSQTLQLDHYSEIHDSYLTKINHLLVNFGDKDVTDTAMLDDLLSALQMYAGYNKSSVQDVIKKITNHSATSKKLGDDVTLLMTVLPEEQTGEHKIGTEDQLMATDAVSSTMTESDATKPKPVEIHFSDKIQPLIDCLSSKADTFPLDTEEIIRKYGKENAIQLVAELVEQKATHGLFFADACSLVRIDELPSKTHEWFKEQGLLVLDNENIKVHLRHKNDFTSEMTGCHEIGEAILNGSPGPCEINFDEKPTHVAQSMVDEHDITEQFPKGAWTEVNIWRKENPRLQFTVTGAYIAGTGPNARGILIPAGKAPIAYVHTRNSYVKGEEERNFYIKQGGMHPNAWYGLYALGLYLKGEIPAI